MKRGTILSVLFVLGLILIDISLSVASAKNITTIYKVTNVSSGGSLQLRAWPSAKSRIKVSLPHNARNITETGKKKVVNGATWLEVHWGKNKGWVNGRYLKKTGVLVKNSKHSSSPAKKPVSRNNPVAIHKKLNSHSRNSHSTGSSSDRGQNKTPPQELGGDRYDQTIDSSAREVKTAYIPKNHIQRKLTCAGNTPKPWNMKMSVSGNTLSISFPGKKTLKVPLRYNEWISNNKARMSLGGSHGRNMVVDVNLERTRACRVNSSRDNYSYEIKTTINNQFYSGCCR